MIAPAPSGSMPRRLTRSRRRRSSICRAAKITARPCATPPPWWRSRARAARRAPPCRRRCSAWKSVRATLRPTSTQEDAWLLLAASALAKDGGKVSLDVGGTTQQRALYRTIRGADLKEPLRITNTGEDPIQGRGDRQRRTDDAGAGRREGLQDRTQDLHARRRSGRRQAGQAEHPHGGGAEDHRVAAAIRSVWR